jgi:threonine/homoserine/homoserine lactone efflux protein
MVSDGPIIVLALLVLTRVPEWLQRSLYAASGLFILYLAYGSFAAWRRDVQGQALPAQTTALSPGNAGEAASSAHSSNDTHQSHRLKEQHGLLSGAIMNALSPGPYIYWTLVTGPILAAGWRETPAYGIGFLAGFYAAMVGTLSAIILLFGTARRVGPRFTRALTALSAIALLGFGFYQLWRALA